MIMIMTDVVFGGDGASGAAGGVGCAGRTGVCQGGAWGASGGGGAGAAGLLFAPAVQPVRPRSARSAVRFGGDAAVCGHRSGARTGAGRDHGVQVPSSAGGARVGGAAV